MNNEFIPSYLAPRKDIFIKNKYEIIKNYPSNDDFHIAIYYIEKNKCKIIIRRLDEETGWGLNLLIDICNIKKNNENETISIGSSNNNEKIIYIYTHIDLEPINYTITQCVPKKIIQTAKNNTYNSLLHYNAIKTFIELNPEYEYYFFTDVECREFIKNNFNENVLYTYDMLVPGAYRADLFRYCYMYIHGGCYFDHKAILRIPLRNIINESTKNIYCKDTANDLMFNAVIIANKESEELRKSYENIVENVKINFYGTMPLEPTGPKLFNKYTHDKNVILNHEVEGTYYTGSRIIINQNNNKSLFANTHYKGYYYNPYTKRDDYTNMFNKREIYFKNYFITSTSTSTNTNTNTNTYIIMQFPTHYDDKFSFNIDDNNKIIIKRVDKNEGWGQQLKIKIINNNSHKEEIITVGNSAKNTKEIVF